MIDTYYGDQSNLIASSKLLEQAYIADPKDANVFVQAARITVLGGFVGFDTYKSGIIERYTALLDKAISLDYFNSKAHILRAQMFERQNDFGNQLMELEIAKSTGTKDPWLSIGYGSYFKNINSNHRAYVSYMDVMQRGPGSTVSERNAYVMALDELTRLVPEGVDRKDVLTKHAALSLKARYPTDAWTPLGYAESFIDEEDFENAIIYAREALKTMDFGAGRLTLGSALYAEAAQQLMAGRKLSDVKPLIVEAGKFGFAKATVIEYLVQRRGNAGSLKKLVPTLNTIIK